MKSIVVGVDGSAGSADALRWAVDEARLHGAHVTALRCWGGRQRADADRLAEDQVAAAAALRTFVEDTVPHDLHLIDQHTIDARAEWGLLEVGADADLLVVGARGASGIRGLIVGSVSQQVLHHAHVPVAVVRYTRWPVQPRRVVVGVDGSPASARALQWAIGEARRRGAELEVVHAWHLMTGAPHPLSVATSRPSGVDQERAARCLLAHAVAAADCSELSRPVHCTLVQGPPGPTIVERAAGAELIVVGSRGRGGFRDLLLGSVSQHVAQHAPCPTIVIRPGGAPP